MTVKRKVKRKRCDICGDLWPVNRLKKVKNEDIDWRLTSQFYGGNKLKKKKALYICPFDVGYATKPSYNKKR